MEAMTQQKKKGGRSRTRVTRTVFGRFLAKHRISYDEAARALGVSRAYVNQLSTGSHASGPSFRLICAIRDYAKQHGGSVPTTAWEGRP